MVNQKVSKGFNENKWNRKAIKNSNKVVLGVEKKVLSNKQFKNSVSTFSTKKKSIWFWNILGNLMIQNTFTSKQRLNLNTHFKKRKGKTRH